MNTCCENTHSNHRTLANGLEDLYTNKVNITLRPVSICVQCQSLSMYTVLWWLVLPIALSVIRRNISDVSKQHISYRNTINSIVPVFAYIIAINSEESIDLLRLHSGSSYIYLALYIVRASL